MKKLISAVLVAAMLGTMLAGCNTSKKSEEATTEFYGNEDESVTVEIDAKEYVELGEYKGLKVEKKTAEVTEADIDAEIEDIRLQYSEFKKISKEVVEKEDVVNLNYTCYCEGEEVDSYSGEDYDLVLGNDDFKYSDTLDFDKALVGKKVGETFTIEGKFDADDYNEEVAGKEGKFEVTVNYIEEEVVPEFTDAFVKENFEYSSVAEYRKAIKEELMESAQSDAEDQYKQDLWEKAVSNAKQIKDFPADKIELEKKNVLLSESEWADYTGMEIGETEEEQNTYFKENYGMTLEEYAKDALLRQCVLQLIVEAEKLEATDAEIDAMVEQEMENGGYSSKEEVYEYASLSDFEEEIIYNKVMAVLEGK